MKVNNKKRLHDIVTLCKQRKIKQNKQINCTKTDDDRQTKPHLFGKDEECKPVL